MTSLVCCSGTVDSGNPVGREEKVAGIDCYISEPSDSKASEKLIVIATDVFGYKLVNARLIADKFAKELNSICIVPDLFAGTEPPANLMDNIEALAGSHSTFGSKLHSVGRLMYYFPSFLIYNSPSTGIRKLTTVINEYKTNRGINKIAMQGYCWGGRIAVMMAQEQNLLDVVCAAHPGGLSFPSDIEKVLKPISFIVPGNDFSMNEKQVGIIRSTLQLKKDADPTYQFLIKEYPGMTHGFAVRGNENDENVRGCRDDALKVAIEFFDTVLRG